MNDRPVIPLWLDPTLILPISEPDWEEIAPTLGLSWKDYKIAIILAAPSSPLGRMASRYFPGARSWRVKDCPGISKSRRLEFGKPRASRQGSGQGRPAPVSCLP